MEAGSMNNTTFVDASTTRQSKFPVLQTSKQTNNAVLLPLLLSSLEHSFILADSLRQWLGVLTGFAAGRIMV